MHGSEREIYQENFFALLHMDFYFFVIVGDIDSLFVCLFFSFLNFC